MSEKLDRTFRRGGIYRRRFHIWYPWSITRPWLPRVFRGGDEWCNDSVVLLAGIGIVIFWRPGKLRTMPCPEEWDLLDEVGRADYAPCGYLYDGHLHDEGHTHWETGACATAKHWLDGRDFPYAR